MGYFCPNCGEIHDTTACPHRCVAARPVREVPVGVNVRVSPPLCTFCGGVVEQKCDCMTKPDRAARIRALANEWAKARHSSRPEVVWQDASEWVDAFDRLEAQERQWIWRELIEEGGE